MLYFLSVFFRGDNMELGKPELFFNDLDIRIELIKSSISEYKIFRSNIEKQFDGKIDQYTTVFIKGLGNDITLHKLFKDLFFESRELLDFILIILQKNYGTNRDFSHFFEKLLENNYDSLDIETIKFLKQNFNFIYRIRKVRNEIKNKPSNIKFRFNTNHLECYFRVPIIPNDEKFLPFIDIKNKSEAISSHGFNCILNLDLTFPEMLDFWLVCLSVLKKDIELKIQNESK